MKTSLIVLCVALMMGGCGGLAGNYNPKVEAKGVQSFFSVNDDEIGYLYNFFVENNSFTPAQLQVVNQSRYAILAIVADLSRLSLAGGVDYQSFKSNIRLAGAEWYLMQPILKAEIDTVIAVEPGIIYGNMVDRINFFLSNCNRIINSAEDDIDKQGMENLMEYGEGFYSALEPIVGAFL